MICNECEKYLTQCLGSLKEKEDECDYARLVKRTPGGIMRTEKEIRDKCQSEVIR